MTPEPEELDSEHRHRHHRHITEAEYHEWVEVAAYYEWLAREPWNGNPQSDWQQGETEIKEKLAEEHIEVWDREPADTED